MAVKRARHVANAGAWQAPRCMRRTKASAGRLVPQCADAVGRERIRE